MKKFKKTTLFLISSSLITPALLVTPLVSTSCNKKDETKTDAEKDKLIKESKELAIKAEKIISEKFNEPEKNQTKENILYLVEQTKKFALLDDDEWIKEVINRLKNFIENNNQSSPSKPTPNPESPAQPKPSNPSTNTNKLPAGSYYENNDYYKELVGLSGQELFKGLIKLQSKYVNGIGTYDALHNIYRSAFKDLYYEKDNSVLDIYSENPNGKDPYNFKFGDTHGGGGKGKEGRLYNREHLIAQSWFNKEDTPRNDAHHVWPTDAFVNQKRGNYPHLTVSNPSFVSKNGTKVDGSYCEPIDAFKGDIARAYFYFAITHATTYQMSRYGLQVFGYENNVPFKNKYSDVYKKWSLNDTIDAFDIIRNNAIANEQGGLRNPFCDYPELVDLIMNSNGKSFVNNGILKINL
ncbi:endonuclease [Mycoplasmopsis primatum]|uniref:endonuclease n=1 Tax=Mycoplasmopsis primatum TaxID=55604 RepID=UPI001F3CE45F|nr:endonuclease [Mycoplasmopsis primatum]